MKRTDVKMLPISTTNMTGFRIMARGLSFTTESNKARRTIFPSNNERR
jgi:hypothetical protein